MCLLRSDTFLEIHSYDLTIFIAVEWTIFTQWNINGTRSRTRKDGSSSNNNSIDSSTYMTKSYLVYPIFCLGNFAISRIILYIKNIFLQWCHIRSVSEKEKERATEAEREWVIGGAIHTNSVRSVRSKRPVLHFWTINCNLIAKVKIKCDVIRTCDMEINWKRFGLIVLSAPRSPYIYDVLNGNVCAHAHVLSPP